MAYTALETNAEANSASSNGHSRKDDDTLAREYLEAIMQGESPTRPNINPHVANWDRLCSNVEQFCVGDADWAKKTIAAHKRNKMFAGLKELLEPREAKQTTPGDQQANTHFPPLPADIRLDPSLARGACISRDEYVKFSKQVSPEGYEHFHEACFWWMLSTIAARRVMIDGESQIYTPLYVILAAESGEYKKSTTARAARKVLREAGLDWLLGLTKSTPQKLIADMAGTLPLDYGDMDFEQQEQVKRRLAFSGQRGWVYGEFGKFVQSMLKKDNIMSDFADLLLLMDDCEDKYENGTKKDGTESIENPYLSLLGCLTPSSVRGSAKSGSGLWSDGTWARCVFVCPPKAEGGGENTDDNDSPFDFQHVPVPRHLPKRLRDWHDRLGTPDIELEPVLDKKGEPTGKYKPKKGPLPETACTLSDDVKKAWVRYRKALKAIQKKMGNEDLNSSYVRLPMLALRIAILVASLENNDRIELPQWVLAQNFAEICRESLHNLYAQVNGTSPHRRLEDEIIDFLKKRDKAATMREMYREGTGSLRNCDPRLVEEAVKRLCKNGIVEIITLSARKQVYTLMAKKESANNEESVEDLELEEGSL